MLLLSPFSLSSLLIACQPPIVLPLLFIGPLLGHYSPSSSCLSSFLFLFFSSSHLAFFKQPSSRHSSSPLSPSPFSPPLGPRSHHGVHRRPCRGDGTRSLTCVSAAVVYFCLCASLFLSPPFLSFYRRASRAVGRGLCSSRVCLLATLGSPRKRMRKRRGVRENGKRESRSSKGHGAHAVGERAPVSSSATISPQGA